MSDAANPVRGEIAISLEGEAYVMRPSYEAITAIEEQTMCALHLLWMSAVSKTMALNNAALIVTECVKAQGRVLQERGDAKGATLAAFNAKAVGGLLYSEGLVANLGTIAQLLRNAIDGGYTAQGEPKPQAINPTETPVDA